MSGQEGNLRNRMDAVDRVMEEYLGIVKQRLPNIYNQICRISDSSSNMFIAGRTLSFVQIDPEGQSGEFARTVTVKAGQTDEQGETLFVSFEDSDDNECVLEVPEGEEITVVLNAVKKAITAAFNNLPAYWAENYSQNELNEIRDTMINAVTADYRASSKPEGLSL